MRNIPKPLSPEDYAQQTRMRDILAAQSGPVTVFYTKRNGQEGSATGPVQFFNGKPGFDTGSVTIDSTETKGRPTTVNLHLITIVKG